MKTEKDNIKRINVLGYTDEIKGFACLWILFFHLGIDCKLSFLNTLKGMGYAGVDIFIFLSGIGCYISLTRCPDLVSFYRKRVKRIFPVYLVCLFVDIIVSVLMYGIDASGITLRTVLANVFGVQQLFMEGYNYIWYITLIVITYILAPIIKSIVDNLDFRGMVMAVLLLVAVTVSFWEAPNYMIVVTRIPIFFVGMALGRLAGNFELKKIRWFMLIVLMAVCFVIMYVLLNHASEEVLWNKGLYWYPYIVITPMMCLFFADVFSRVESFSILKWLGKRSFEIFLVQVTVIKVWRYCAYVRNLSDRNLYWVILFFLIIVFADGVFNLNNKLMHKRIHGL